jgi:hypothetical protein
MTDKNFNQQGLTVGYHRMPIDFAILKKLQ